MREADIAALRDFDTLPGSANVRLPVVAALFSISPATVWRWCRAGLLPNPTHIGGVTFWNVHELRARLQTSTRELPSSSGTTPPGCKSKVEP